MMIVFDLVNADYNALKSEGFSFLFQKNIVFWCSKTFLISFEGLQIKGVCLPNWDFMAQGYSLFER